MVTRRLPHWCTRSISEPTQPPGHDGLIDALHGATQSAPPPNRLPEARRVEFADLMTMALLVNALGRPESIDALAHPIRASLPLSGITDAFCQDSPCEPMSATEYALEFTWIIAECWRLGFIGSWDATGPFGNWFECDSQNHFVFREARFRGGCIAGACDCSLLATVRSRFCGRLPTWLQPFFRLMRVSHCDYSISEKPLALGEWQHRALECMCDVDLLVFGPYVLCGQKGGTTDKSE